MKEQKENNNLYNLSVPFEICQVKVVIFHNEIMKLHNETDGRNQVEF